MKALESRQFASSLLLTYYGQEVEYSYRHFSHLGHETSIIQEDILYPANDPEERLHYRGDVCNGLPWGNGSMTWTFGARYDGSWIDGKRHGIGTYTFKSKFDLSAFPGIVKVFMTNLKFNND